MTRAVRAAVLSIVVAAFGCEQNSSSRATAGSEQTSTTQVLQLRVTGMTCEGCAEQIRETLHGQRGIIGVSTDVDAKLVSVEYDPTLTTHAEVTAKLLTKGYESERLP